MILFAVEIARNFYFISHGKIIDFSSFGAVSTLTAAAAGKLCVNNWGRKKGSVLVPFYSTQNFMNLSLFLFCLLLQFIFEFQIEKKTST
jgi:hypothetical protein